MRDKARVPTETQGPVPDLIVVLSGPREGKGRNRRFNANFARLRAGLELEVHTAAPLLVSGHFNESGDLRREIGLVCYKLGLPGSNAKVCRKAFHTAGNAAYTLQAARRMFGFERISTRIEQVPMLITVCTHAWHVPRARVNYTGIQRLLGAKNLTWAFSVPFRFNFVGVPSDDLDSEFLEEIVAEEPRKLREDEERIQRWYRRSVSDAPTMVQKVLAENAKDFDVDYTPSERELATALTDIDRSTPELENPPFGDNVHRLVSNS